MFPKSIVVSVIAVCAATIAATGRAQVGPQTAPVVMSAFDGQDQFATYCASCHGTSAKGDGVVGALLAKKPPDLTTFAARNGGTFDSALVFAIIDGRKAVKGHGGADMPVWGDAFSKSLEGSSPAAIKDRIDAVVKYLGRIQRPLTTP
jgi:mono/diheme cytochrome c family protein